MGFLKHITAREEADNELNEYGLSIINRCHKNRRLAFAKITPKEAIDLVRRTFNDALAGDKDARKLIFPYLYGAPAIEINVNAKVETRTVAEILSPEQKKIIGQRMIEEADEEAKPIIEGNADGNGPA